MLSSDMHVLRRLMRRWLPTRLFDGPPGHHKLEVAALSEDAGGVASLLRADSQDVAAGTGPPHPRRAGVPHPRVAVLARSRFTKDARAIAAEIDSERVLLLKRVNIKAIGRTFLPENIGDMRYKSLQTENAAALSAYRSFLVRMWRHFDPEGDIKLVLTANTSYWAEVEFGAALGELAVPFVAIHKENLKSDGHAALWEESYREERAPFMGSAVLVHNQRERDMQVRTGIVPKDRIHVVGMARLDNFHAHRQEMAGRNPGDDLLFASFLPGDGGLPRQYDFNGFSEVLGLPIPNPDERPEHFVEACVAFHRVAVAVARRLPDRRVVIKTKGRMRDREWIPRLIAHGAVPGVVPSNLTIAHGGDAAAMTRSAAMVLGFNTTMLLEAIAAGIPAVVLAIGEEVGAVPEFVIDLRDAAVVLADEHEALDFICTLAAAPTPVNHDLPDAARKVLDVWTGNSDGLATQRTVACLHEAMMSISRRSHGAVPPGGA